MGLLGLMYFAGLAALALCSIGSRLNLSLFSSRRPSLHGFALTVIAFAVLATLPQDETPTTAAAPKEANWVFMPSATPLPQPVAAEAREVPAPVVETPYPQDVSEFGEPVVDPVTPAQAATSSTVLAAAQ